MESLISILESDFSYFHFFDLAVAQTPRSRSYIDCFVSTPRHEPNGCCSARFLDYASIFENYWRRYTRPPSDGTVVAEHR
ncbi:hypothetical protein BCEP4_770013 [Burkholderia cepacia]|nr:hypothetical protein BCEP4_770013 [Burkholderia cepacia]